MLLIAAWQSTVGKCSGPHLGIILPWKPYTTTSVIPVAPEPITGTCHYWHLSSLGPLYFHFQSSLVWYRETFHVLKKVRDSFSLTSSLTIIINFSHKQVAKIEAKTYLALGPQCLKQYNLFQISRLSWSFKVAQGQEVVDVSLQKDKTAVEKRH